MVVRFSGIVLPYCRARLAPRQPGLDIKDITIEDLTGEQIDALVVRLMSLTKTICSIDAALGVSAPQRKTLKSRPNDENPATAIGPSDEIEADRTGFLRFVTHAMAKGCARILGHASRGLGVESPHRVETIFEALFAVAPL
jgi:hypothetical protein